MAPGARRIGIATLISLTLCISTLNTAVADDEGSKPEINSKLEFKNEKQKFEYEDKAYKAAIAYREEAREKINKKFKKAIKKALANAQIALASATTAEQKLSIMNKLKNARMAAVAIRDAALATLGSLPLPPVEPKMDEKRRTLAP